VRGIILLMLSVVTYTPVFANIKTDTSVHKPAVIKKDSSRQRDLMDVVHSLFHTNFSSSGDSIGFKPVTSVVPAIGYALQSRMAVLLSGNTAFRTGSKSRISVINFSTSYTQNAQFTLPVLWSIWSKTNDYDFVGEMKFYSYPQSTFGLGSNSSIGNPDPMNYNYIRLSEKALRKISGNFYAGPGYIMDDHWGISQQVVTKNDPANFVNYSPATHTVSSGLTLSGVFDTRDCSINPSKGFYAMCQYRENLTALGSTSAWNSLIVDVRKYFRFPENSNDVLAFWSYNSLTLSGKPPYLDLPATLWDTNTNTGRGYIQGRFRGAQMVYMETEFRYRITSDGLIGGVVFANAQSFSGAPGTRLQALQPGYGPGLRVKLNKASKTNIDIDYGLGREGSKGLFVNIGELF
jgi:outer membrane protein assembly factor BamA